MLFSNDNPKNQYGVANLNGLQSRKWSTMCLMMVCATVLTMMPDLAHAAGLQQASSGLTNFLSEIQPIVRTLAIISIIGAGIGYMMNMVDKSMFFKIIAGIIIIASASEVVNFFWT